jgi:hypothetical protein
VVISPSSPIDFCEGKLAFSLMNSICAKTVSAISLKDYQNAIKLNIVNNTLDVLLILGKSCYPNPSWTSKAFLRTYDREH